MNRKKAVIAVCALLVVLAGMIYVSTWQDFDAQGYVQAVLDTTFKGHVRDAADMIEQQNENQLYINYEEGIDSFLDNNVLSGVKASAEVRGNYKILCKDIFKSMQYEVKQASQISRREMEVPVEYREVDIFPNFVNAVKEESVLFLADAENGTYKGTKEEISAQMQTEFLNRSYELLREAYENAEYGETKVMTFRVTGDEKNVFSVDETQISEFIAKILRIDEIQD